MNHASLVNMHLFSQVISSHVELALLRVAEPFRLRLACPCGKRCVLGQGTGKLMERKKDWLLARDGSAQKQGGSIITFSPSNNPAQHYLLGRHRSQSAVMSVAAQRGRAEKTQKLTALTGASHHLAILVTPIHMCLWMYLSPSPEKLKA